MKIALIGYGKMGKALEEVAIERGHKILFKFDINNLQEFTEENLKKVDVALEFTTPKSAYDNILKCLEAGVPVVSGTTGWTQNLHALKQKALEEGKAFFYSPNFSLGVNILFRLNRELAKIMNKLADYDVFIKETHHIHKLDAPSGTAIKLAEDIIKNIDRKKRWSLTEKDDEVLHITAIREGEIPGIHEIFYESDEDILLLKHSLKSRKALAKGAILAAEFIKDKKGFFTMDDLLSV